MPGRDANLTGPQHQGPGEFTTAYGSQDLAAASGAIFTVTGMVKVRNIVGAVTTVLATSTSLAIFAGALRLRLDEIGKDWEADHDRR